MDVGNTPLPNHVNLCVVLALLFSFDLSLQQTGIRAEVSNSAENDVWIHAEDRQIHREKQFQSVEDKDGGFAEATGSVGAVSER